MSLEEIFGPRPRRYGHGIMFTEPAVQQSAVPIVDLVMDDLRRDWEKARDEHGWSLGSKPTWELRWHYIEPGDTPTD